MEINDHPDSELLANETNKVYIPLQYEGKTEIDLANSIEEMWLLYKEDRDLPNLQSNIRMVLEKEIGVYDATLSLSLDFKSNLSDINLQTSRNKNEDMILTSMKVERVDVKGESRLDVTMEREKERERMEREREMEERESEVGQQRKAILSLILEEEGIVEERMKKRRNEREKRAREREEEEDQRNPFKGSMVLSEGVEEIVRECGVEEEESRDEEEDNGAVHPLILSPPKWYTNGVGLVDREVKKGDSSDRERSDVIEEENSNFNTVTPGFLSKKNYLTLGEINVETNYLHNKEIIGEERRSVNLGKFGDSWQMEPYVSRPPSPNRKGEKRLDESSIIEPPPLSITNKIDSARESVLRNEDGRMGEEQRREAEDSFEEEGEVDEEEERRRREERLQKMVLSYRYTEDTDSLIDITSALYNRLEKACDEVRTMMDKKDRLLNCIKHDVRVKLFRLKRELTNKKLMENERIKEEKEVKEMKLKIEIKRRQLELQKKKMENMRKDLIELLQRKQRIKESETENPFDISIIKSKSIGYDSTTAGFHSASHSTTHDLPNRTILRKKSAKQQSRETAYFLDEFNEEISNIISQSMENKLNSSYF